MDNEFTSRIVLGSVVVSTFIEGWKVYKVCHRTPRPSPSAHLPHYFTVTSTVTVPYPPLYHNVVSVTISSSSDLHLSLRPAVEQKYLTVL